MKVKPSATQQAWGAECRSPPAVSPKLMALYRKAAMSLDQLMAFTVSDDHAAQEACVVRFGVKAGSYDYASPIAHVVIPTAAALQRGEVDWVEQPVMDLVPSLRKDANLKVEVVETTGLIGVLRFNQLFPPFDNAAIRRAALKAVNQSDFMAAVAGEADPGVINAHVGFFAPSSPYASDAGMEMLSGKFKLDALKREVEQAGYKGEKVVFLGATDVARISAICQVGADVLSKIGLNVDYVTTDWGTVVQRITRKQPIAEGGWSIFGSMWGGYDWYSPAGNAALRGNGMNAWFGWPDAPKLEALRDQWLRAPDLATQKALARDIQLQAFEDVPCMPLGLYYQPVAYRNDLMDMMKGLILFTGVRRA